MNRKNNSWRRSGSDKLTRVSTCLLVVTATVLSGLTSGNARGQTPPVITIQPASQTSTAGANVNLSVTASGAGPLRYKWFFNGAPLPGNIITTLAGGGHLGDGLPAAAAILNNPYGIAVDSFGSVFIADQNDSLVRKVDTNGIITTFAGTGATGYSGDGGAATNANLNQPSGVALDSYGNLFIADFQANVVRKVDTNGVITTVAGNGTGAYSGDGGPATRASLNFPNAIALDASGNLFIVDGLNNRIRKVDTRGIITTVAGNGTEAYSGDGGLAIKASLNLPGAIACDTSGNLFICDNANNRIRKVDAGGIITTVAGNGTEAYSGDGGSATNAALLEPDGIALDASGDLFIAESAFFTDVSCRVRKVDARGIITTVAGNGNAGDSGDGRPATKASLNAPAGLAFGKSGNLLIADVLNNKIRQVDSNGVISTFAGNGSTNYTGDGGLAVDSLLNVPDAVIVDSVGNVFIAEANNALVRKINPQGVLTTVAGNGSASDSGDGGPATKASLVSPAGLALDNLGDLLIADGGADVIRSVDTHGIITTLAGDGLWGFSGDGGPATKARLNSPEDAAVNSLGEMFIADDKNNRIRKVDTNGIITTVVGIGAAAYAGNGGPAAEASLNNPTDVTLDASGNLLVADAGNNVIRRVDTNGVITTIAGTGSAGFSGEGAPATKAQFNYPGALKVDPFGNLLIADQGNNIIRQVNTSGLVTTIAGNRSAGFSGDGGPAAKARLNNPSSLALTPDGNLVVADAGNNRVRQIGLAGFPNLAMENISATNAGAYQVVVSSPFGSVTSLVATLTVAAPGLLMSTPVVSGETLLLGFTPPLGTTPAFHLLQAPDVTGPWTTNTAAVLTTNSQPGSYLFTLPVPGVTEFYRVRAP